MEYEAHGDGGIVTNHEVKLVERNHVFGLIPNFYWSLLTVYKPDCTTS
jgi:hypothetical protein